MEPATWCSKLALMLPANPAQGLALSEDPLEQAVDLQALPEWQTRMGEALVFKTSRTRRSNSKLIELQERPAASTNEADRCDRIGCRCAPKKACLVNQNSVQSSAQRTAQATLQRARTSGCKDVPAGCSPLPCSKSTRQRRGPAQRGRGRACGWTWSRHRRGSAASSSFGGWPVPGPWPPPARPSPGAEQRGKGGCNRGGES